MTRAALSAYERPAPQAVRILERFEQLARDVGPRHAGMARLARDLGISTKTIYQHFPTKAELVMALIRYRDVAWRQQRDGQLEANMPARRRILGVASSWVAHVSSFSPSFWEELALHFPEAHRVMQDAYASFMQQGGENLRGAVRPDANPDVALRALKLLIEKAADRDYCAELGATPLEVLREHVDVWARGALRPEELS